MSELVSICFTGDIGFDRYMDHQWEDPELISQGLFDFLHSSDHVVANVEGPLVSQERNTSTEGTAQLMHTMDPAVTSVLRNMHADVWNLCNNHIMDAGEMGVSSTLEEASKAGVMTIGAGMNLDEARRPIIFEDAGGIGLISVGYRRGCKPAAEDHAGCFLWHEMDLIQESIAQIKEKCRWCVVIAHGGEEFTSLPTPYTRDRYLAYLEMGADIVVSHHPHVPMNYELVGEKIIFYSLGNFIFDTDYQRAQFNTDIGILLKLNFSADEYSFEAKGIRIDREKEHIVEAPLPRIFRDVPENEYRLLAPLAAKMFVAATKRQQIYLNPLEYKDADDTKWETHFANPKRSGRVEGEGLDFFIILPLARKADLEEWKNSSLDDVKEYILEQM